MTHEFMQDVSPAVKNHRTVLCFCSAIQHLKTRNSISTINAVGACLNCCHPTGTSSIRDGMVMGYQIFGPTRYIFSGLSRLQIHPGRFEAAATAGAPAETSSKCKLSFWCSLSSDSKSFAHEYKATVACRWLGRCLTTPEAKEDQKAKFKYRKGGNMRCAYRQFGAKRSRGWGFKVRAWDGAAGTLLTL